MNNYFEKRNYPLSKLWVMSDIDFSPSSLEDKLFLGKEKITINVQYKMDNNFIIKKGLKFKVKHLGNFQCVACKKVINKHFDSHCFTCFKNSASTDKCIMNPYLCHFLEGTCREQGWAEKFCYQPHYVYLAYTDKFKVGITRQSQVPVRWVDQGATSAVLLAKVTSRHQAGVIEKVLKEILSDRSYWLRMLTNENHRPSKNEFSDKLLNTINWLRNHKDFLNNEIIVKTPIEFKLDNEITLFDSPVIVDIQYESPVGQVKYKTLNLDKNNEINGLITGIKGQYIFLGENVFNFRKHEGYLVDIDII